MWWIALALAAPSDLAPGAPELLVAQQRLEGLLGTARATGEATSRLQAAWTLLPVPKEVCGPVKEPEVGGEGGDAKGADAKGVDEKAVEDAKDAEPKAIPEDPAVTRLEIGWRIERFGSAWREASQAVRAQAERVRRYRSSATVAPLVDARWTAALEALEAAAERNDRAFLEASAWQLLYVRPTLAACPAVEPAPRAGISMLHVPVRGEAGRKVAVLALGDGWLCTPGGARAERADEGVLLVPGVACWSASPTCGCAPAGVEPGAILGRLE